MRHPRPRLFFCHIPKTAGTSLRTALERLYRPEEVMPTLAMIRANGGNYTDLAEVAEAMRQRPGEARMLRGHYHLSAAELLGAGAARVVILRDPVRRTISHLKHAIVHHGMDIKVVREQLHQQRVPLPKNVQARFVAGRFSLGPQGIPSPQMTGFLKADVSDDWLRDEALAALVECEFAGTADRVQELADRLSACIFDSTKILVPKENQAPSVALELSTRDVQVIANWNSVDGELVDYVRRTQQSGGDSPPHV